MTTRLHDWQVRLEAAMLAGARARFRWGHHDCVHFAARCVEAVTGERPLDQLPAWSNREEARQVIESLGDLRAAVGLAMGEEIGPTFARPGDIGLASTAAEAWPQCLAVHGGACWLAPAPFGLVPVPDSEIITAWRVDHA